MNAWRLDPSGGDITVFKGSGLTANFGTACSMSSIGSTIYAIVTAETEKSGALSNKGAAYIYIKNTTNGSNWILDPSGGNLRSNNDNINYFGKSCSMCSIGNTVYAIVGADGAAYVFLKNTANGSNWILDPSGGGDTNFKSNDASGSYFGYSSSICSIQNTLYAIVGSPAELGGLGAAYVFLKDTTKSSGWILDPSGGGNTLFRGKNVSIDSGYAFGASCHICSINNTIYAIVTSAYDSTNGVNAGAVYVYLKNTTNSVGWILDPSGGNINVVNSNSFGECMSVCFIGTTLYIAITNTDNNIYILLLFFKNTADTLPWQQDPLSGSNSPINPGILAESIPIFSIGTTLFLFGTGGSLDPKVGLMYYKDTSNNSDWIIYSYGKLSLNNSLISSRGYESFVLLHNSTLYIMTTSNSYNSYNGAANMNKNDIPINYLPNYTPVIYASQSFVLPPVAQSRNAIYFIKKTVSKELSILSYLYECNIDIDAIYNLLAVTGTTSNCAVILSCDGNQWWILASYGDTNSPLLTNSGGLVSGTVINQHVFITSTSNQRIQLPPPDGSIRIIIQTGATAKSIIITSAQTIDGFTSITLSRASADQMNVGCILVSDLTKWYILSYYTGLGYIINTNNYTLVRNLIPVNYTVYLTGMNLQVFSNISLNNKSALTFNKCISNVRSIFGFSIFYLNNTGVSTRITYLKNNATVNPSIIIIYINTGINNYNYHCAVGRYN